MPFKICWSLKFSRCLIHSHFSFFFNNPLFIVILFPYNIIKKCSFLFCPLIFSLLYLLVWISWYFVDSSCSRTMTIFLYRMSIGIGLWVSVWIKWRWLMNEGIGIRWFFIKIHQKKSWNVHLKWSEPSNITTNHHFKATTPSHHPHIPLKNRRTSTIIIVVRKLNTTKMGRSLKAFSHP